MTFPYRDAVAVVTGASSGLGRALATALERRGAVVTGVSRRSEPSCDVADLPRWTELLQDIEARHGRIDLLVNAAGVERRLGARELDGESLDAMFDVNFRAAAHGTLAVLPGMLDRGHGAIVNVSSDHGRAPGPRTPAYCASKAALSAFTESLAHEVAGSGVHLHVLYPGWVPTPLGQGAVDQGMPMPPRAVRRTEEQVTELTLARIGGRSFEINAAKVAVLAPAVRALLPPIYRRSMRKMA